MKVIGRVGEGNYLLEATVEEIAALADRDVTFVEGYYNRSAVDVGTKFAVKGAFVQIHRNENRKREVEMLRKAIEGMLVNLDMMEPFVDEPKVEVKEENHEENRS